VITTEKPKPIKTHVVQERGPIVRLLLSTAPMGKRQASAKFARRLRGQRGGRREI